MNKLPNLPFELIDKIIMMRPINPAFLTINRIINHYRDIYDSEDNYITFKTYINVLNKYKNYKEINDSDYYEIDIIEYDHLFYLYCNYYIKLKRKRDNENLKCDGCNKNIHFNDDYYTTGSSCLCFKCMG